MNALLNAAWDAECTEPSDKLVLVYLADRANLNGKAWPHLPTIARQTGLGKRTIIEVIKRLESRGHLTVERKAGCSNRYVVHPKVDARAGAAKAPAAAARERCSHGTATSAATAPTSEPHGTIKGNGRLAPRFKRENWQLLRDEKALKERLGSRAGIHQPRPRVDRITEVQAARNPIRYERPAIAIKIKGIFLTLHEFKVRRHLRAYEPKNHSKTRGEKNQYE